MNAFVDTSMFEISDTGSQPTAQSDTINQQPMPEAITKTDWGYIVADKALAEGHRLRSILARFGGGILLVAAAALWLVPDSAHGPEVAGMKLGAMLLFSLFGAALVLAGRQKPGLEMQVDQRRHEVRLGHRTISGEFDLVDMLRFEEVRSVYLLRGQDARTPTRLYLRFGDGNAAVEVARGAPSKMEAIRARLTEDMRPKSERAA